MPDPIWLAVLIPIVGMALFITTARYRRLSRRIDMMSGGDPSLPSAQEIARSTERFHKVAERYLLVDSLWRRYRSGELIFLPESREKRRSRP